MNKTISNILEANHKMHQKKNEFFNNHKSEITIAYMILFVILIITIGLQVKFYKDISENCGYCVCEDKFYTIKEGFPKINLSDAWGETLIHISIIPLYTIVLNFSVAALSSFSTRK